MKMKEQAKRIAFALLILKILELRRKEEFQRVRSHQSESNHLAGNPTVRKHSGPENLFCDWLPTAGTCLTAEQDSSVRPVDRSWWNVHLIVINGPCLIALV